MIPPGFSHVDYPLTPRQMAALCGADLYVKVGHPSFDYRAAVHRSLPGAARRRPDRGHVAGHAADRRRGRSTTHDGHGHDHGDGDPHVWVAPETVARGGRQHRPRPRAADPAGTPPSTGPTCVPSWRRSTGSTGRSAPSWPAAPVRKFMVYHPAWGYFARQYGLEQIAIEAEGKEPGAARLIQLIDRARREGVPRGLRPGRLPAQERPGDRRRRSAAGWCPPTPSSRTGRTTSAGWPRPSGRPVHD